MRNEKILEIIIESLLFSASPDCRLIEERPLEEYKFVIEHMMKMAGLNITGYMKLDNIEIFIEDSSAESAFLSSIKQLLGDKLKITDLSEDDSLAPDTPPSE